jgi:hypothetical protein
LQKRLARENKLGHGDGQRRQAKLRRIASKCDHCVSYADQACISACPTSALWEIPPEAAFTQRTDALTAAAKQGFEYTAFFDAKQIFDPQKFYRGLSKQDDQAKKKESRLSMGWLWAIGLLGFFVCLLEIVLRKYWPEQSLLFHLRMREPGMDADMARANVEFRVGTPFSLWLGYIGAAVLFSSTLYPLHKWIPRWKQHGSQRSWFDYHVFSGTVGPLLLALHSTGKLDNWVSLAIYAMLITVVSGVVGRYLCTELPDLASQATLKIMDYERRLAELRNRHAGIHAIDRYLERQKRRYAGAAQRSGFTAGGPALRMLFRDVLAQPWRAFLLRRRLRGLRDGAARRQIAQVATDLLLFERRRILYPRIEPMFRQWKIVHLPFAIALTILSLVHVVIELGR